jgi:outer membrane protein TolC
MKHHILHVLLLPVIGMCTLLHAQESSEGKPLTLRECIAIGLDKSFDVQQRSASTKSAAARLVNAFGAYLPSAEVTANYSRQLTNLREQFSIVNGVPIVGQPLPNTYGLNGSLNLNVFDGFRRESEYSSAQEDLSAARSDVAYTRAATRFNITRQFIEVARRKQVLNARRETVGLAQATLERTKELVRVGRGTQQDVNSQETELANQEVGLIQAENDVATAKAQLLATMSVNPSQLIDIIEDELPADVTPQSVSGTRARIGSEAEAISRAFAERSDLESASFREHSAKSQIGSAAAGYYPSLSASGGYTWRNFSIGDFDRQGQVFAGIFIRVPVFDQFATHRNVEAATLSHTQSLLDIERLKNQIRTDIRSAYLQLTSAEKGLDVTARAMSFAKFNADAVRERYNVGASTMLDVQTANNQLITAQINRISAVFTYHAAVAAVEFSIGEMEGNL